MLNKIKSFFSQPLVKKVTPLNERVDLVVARFLGVKVAYGSAQHTLDQYKQCLKKFFDFTGWNLKALNIGSLAEFLKEQTNPICGGIPDWSGPTACHRAKLIYAFLVWLKAEGYICFEPVPVCTYKRGKRDSIILPPLEKYQHLLLRHSSKALLVVRIAGAMGMRTSEILSLKRRDLIYKQGLPYSFKIRVAKHSSYREVHIPTFLVEDIAECFEDLAQGDFLFSYTKWYISKKLLPFASRIMGSEIVYRLKDYRVMFASFARTLGVDVFVVSKVLGHSDISTTYDFYNVISVSEERAAMDVFSRAIIPGANKGIEVS